MFASDHTSRTHSLKMKQTFGNIAGTGIDLIIRIGKRTIKFEIKETYGKSAKFCLKPKDLEAHKFIFYYPDTDTYYLVNKSALPVKNIAKSKATSVSIKDVKEMAYFFTSDEEKIKEKVGIKND